MKTCRCEQCGATVDRGPEVLSSTCAFCGSALVEVDRDRSAVDAAVPFAVDRTRAGRLLKGFLQGQWLAPEALRKAAATGELAATYVPFYCYDATARSRYEAEIGVHWMRTETYTVVENGKTVTKTRQVQETDWHDLSGTHAHRWFNHLVSASLGLPESEANALEPFDLGRAVAFEPAMVAGVSAEHPTVAPADAQVVAADELERLDQARIGRHLLPGDTHRGLRSACEVQLDALRLVLLPVWIAAVPGPNGPLRMLVNGQTGEVVGEVPRSGWKIALAVALVLLPIAMAVAAAMGVAGLGAAMGAR